MTKKITVAVWLILAVAALAYVYQYGRSIQQVYPTRTFTVDGEARMNLVPDIAKFSVSVVSEGPGVSDIQRANTDKMNAVQDFLKDMGVERKDLQTTQYNLNPRYDYAPCDGRGGCPAPRIGGYTLTQELTVKVRETEKIGDMLAGVTEKGANTVSGVTFAVDDDKAARTAARGEAIGDARKKAKDLAKAGGFEVGSLVGISEDQGMYPLAYNAKGGMMEAGVAASSAPALEPGTQDSTVRVVVTFEIVN